MFSWAGTGPSIGIEPDKERNPPPPPTSLEFPQYDGLLRNDGVRRKTDFDAIYQKLLAVKKPQDITLEHISTLNLKIEADIEGTQMISPEKFQGLAPLVWENPTEDSAEPNLMSSGFPYPSFAKYDLARKELLFENDDAYREVTRMQPRPGREKVRLTQSRKFWSGLERMAQYWDSSLDEYYDKPSSSKTTDQDPSPGKQQQQSDTETGDINSAMDTGDSASEKVETYERVYKGRRVGAGHETPSEIRDDIMRGFLEMVAWPFQCQASVPTQPPKLIVRNLLFPVRHTLVAGRVPREREAARSGTLEGPILGIQCREETTFRDPGEAPGYGQKELCDVFREVGAMLLLAQERSREGTIETKPGEGKWWTTIPRWGGAPNEGVTGEAADREKHKEKQRVTDGQDNGNGNGNGNGTDNIHKRSRYSHPLRSARRAGRARKLSVSEKWKIIEPGPSLWDKRTKYMQIGKPKGSLYDDIFMLSQINHHVSILHLRVHGRYVDCLTTGSSNISEESDADQPWDVLKLRRSKWYDLMDAGQRLEAYNSLWKLFHYLMRESE